MGYREVMDLPIKTFWFLGSQIHRVLAERDMRGLTIAYSAQSAEGAKETRERLVLEMGEVMKSKPEAEELDRAGLHGLTSLRR